ncbi:MAG: hypothetical protein ACJ79A_14470 [Gemmatimonadaceae bacterium]
MDLVLERMSMLRSRRSVSRVLPLVVFLLACGKPEGGPAAFRGPGLDVASLGVNDEAAVNAAALGAAFNPDPSLFLLLDPVYLPRVEGRAGGTPVPPAVIARMKAQGAVRGTCQPPRDDTRAVPLCPAELPGYVVRFSEIFAIGRGADSVQVYLAATRYRHQPKAPAELLSFERAYRVARVRGAWRVLSEARVPKG